MARTRIPFNLLGRLWSNPPRTTISFKKLGKLRANPPANSQSDRNVIFTQASRLSKRRHGPSLRDIVSKAVYSSNIMFHQKRKKGKPKKDPYENLKPLTCGLSPARLTGGKASKSNMSSTRIEEVTSSDQDSDSHRGGPSLVRRMSSESSGRLCMKVLDIMPGDSADMKIESFDSGSSLEEENVLERLGNEEEAVGETVNLLQHELPIRHSNKVIDSDHSDDDLFICQTPEKFKATSGPNQPDTTNWKFVTTNLPTLARTLVTRWVDSLDCRGMASKIDEEVTHVVVGTGPDMQSQRTLKYLQAVASGKLVVSHLWIERATKLGCIAPGEEFEVKDEENGGSNGPWRSRVARESGKPGIFNRFEVFISEDLEGLSKDDVEDLLVRAGARCVPDENAFSYSLQNTMVIIADSVASMEEKVVNRRLRSHELATVDKEWLLDSLGDGAARPLLPYMMEQVTVQDLVTAGYSAQLTNADI